MTQSHENQNHNLDRSQEIHTALTEAQDISLRLRQDPSFHQTCVEQGIDPLQGGDNRDYWHAYREHVLKKTASGRQAGQDPLKMDAIDLIASTPAYIIEQQRLSTGQSDGYADRRSSKEFASYFNSGLRNFAYLYPETSVQSVSAAMLGTVAKNIPNRALREASARQVQDTIRGAQHELAFGQILLSAGISCRETTVDEDLKGIDYVVGNGRDALNVDVKASLSQIEAKGSGTLFAVSRDSVTMYSMTLDREFNDRFFIDPAAAIEKSTSLAAQLQMAKTAIAKIA